MLFGGRSTLLWALLVSSCLLLTAFGRNLREDVAIRDTESELVDLLSELSEKLHNRKVVEKPKYRTLFDNENEERWRMTDEETRYNTAERIIDFNDMSHSALTADQQQHLVGAINDRRRRVGASDMYQVTWNEKLGRLAQTWAKDCKFEHGNPAFDMDIVGFSQVGGNIWASDGPFDADKIVDSWYNEKANFNEQTQTCNSDAVCGPYKQLVTAQTTDVGCGLTTCSSLNGISNAQFVVCYFAPPGNYHKEPTFTKGSPCTSCKKGYFYCVNDLCNNAAECTSSGSNCECKANCHCGTKTSDCRCTCPPGSAGVNCAKPCDDADDCKSRKAQWKPSHCNDNFPFVFDICPKMCGKCTDGDPCPN